MNQQLETYLDEINTYGMTIASLEQGSALAISRAHKFSQTVMSQDVITAMINTLNFFAANVTLESYAYKLLNRAHWLVIRHNIPLKEVDLDFSF